MSDNEMETMNVEEAPAPVKVSHQPEAALPNKTGINERLDEAVRVMPPVNRSADLVPLTHDYDFDAQKVESSHCICKVLQGFRAWGGQCADGCKSSRRLCFAENFWFEPFSHDIFSPTYAQVVAKVSSLSEKSPIFDQVGNTATASFASITEESSTNTKSHAVEYQASVIDYCLEWERIITSRVDAGVKEVKQLHDRLVHYENKLDGLRQKERIAENLPRGTPPKLTEKLERNEEKLDQAWKAHERSASKLCNLIEQIVNRGHKDLYPLVLNMLQWEVEQASGENEIFGRLPETAESLMETMDKVQRVRPQDEGSLVKIALADSGHPVDSGEMAELSLATDTTGSYHSDQAIYPAVEEEEEHFVEEQEEEEFVEEEEEEEEFVEEEQEPAEEEEEHMMTPPASPKKEMDMSKAEEIPMSPDRVTDFGETHLQEV